MINKGSQQGQGDSHQPAEEIQSPLYRMMISDCFFWPPTQKKSPATSNRNSLNPVSGWRGGEYTCTSYFLFGFPFWDRFVGTKLGAQVANSKADPRGKDVDKWLVLHGRGSGGSAFGGEFWPGWCLEEGNPWQLRLLMFFWFHGVS